LDRETRVLSISHSLKEGVDGLYVGNTKTKKRRSLIISADTLAALLRHEAMLHSQRYRGPIMFPDRNGGHMRRQNFDRRDWRRLIEKAELESGLSFDGITFHSLRHTCATMLLAAGEPIAEVAARLGHSKISTTLDYYGHALPENRERPADRFSARLSSYALGQQKGQQQKLPDAVLTKRNPQSLTGRGFRMVPRARIELATPGFSDLCSTD
jgi:integrase